MKCTRRSYGRSSRRSSRARGSRRGGCGGNRVADIARNARSTLAGCNHLIAASFPSLWLVALAFIVIVASAATTRAQVVKPAVREQLIPTGKLRIGVAAGLTPGTGNVAIDPAGGPP